MERDDYAADMHACTRCAVTIDSLTVLFPATGVALAGLGLLGCGAAGVKQPQSTQPSVPLRLVVHVEGCQDAAGPVRCAVYRDPSRFMTREGIWQGASAAVKQGEARFEFQVMSGVRVAISAFQDLDSNEQLDRGTLGLPMEPWGTSGEFSAFGPPSWRRSSIVPTSEEAEITIRLVRTGRAQDEGFPE
jgi:uncharacterized protein (DUF2141 family)